MILSLIAEFGSPRPACGARERTCGFSANSGLVGVLVLLLWPRRPLHRRQRLDVVRDRVAVLRTELRGVADHAHHRAAGAVAVRRLPGLQEIGNVLLAPVGSPLLGDVGHEALAFGIGPARKTLRGDDAAKQIAR